MPYEKSSVKLLYGEAFRAPNNYEMYWSTPEMSKANPDIEPEKIKTYEAIYEQYIKNNLRGAIIIFYYKIDNLINQAIDPEDGLIFFTNTEEVEAKGFELEMENKWKNGIEGRASYSFQETKNLQSGDILSNSPKHLIKLNLNFPLLQEKIFLGWETQYTSRRKTLSGNYADGFLIMNTTLFSQNLLKKLEASISIYNLFDVPYEDPGSGEHAQDAIEQDGRSFRFKLAYKF